MTSCAGKLDDETKCDIYNHACKQIAERFDNPYMYETKYVDVHKNGYSKRKEVCTMLFAPCLYALDDTGINTWYNSNVNGVWNDEELPYYITNHEYDEIPDEYKDIKARYKRIYQPYE
jgi:hypothetical protein